MLLKLILLSFISISVIFCDSENESKACKKRKRLEKMLAIAEKQDQNSDSSHPLMSKYDEFVERNKEEISINMMKSCHSKKFVALPRLVNTINTQKSQNSPKSQNSQNSSKLQNYLTKITKYTKNKIHKKITKFVKITKLTKITKFTKSQNTQTSQKSQKSQNSQK